MSVLVRRLILRNYKSIAKAVVDLSDLTVLVGPNGVGKSNLIDALRFVADSLDTTLDLAMRQRGGIGAVRRHSGGHPNDFAIAMNIRLAQGQEAHYALQIGARPNGAFVVQHEQAVISAQALDDRFFEVRRGDLTTASPDLATAPKATEDRLFLTTVSGVPAFRTLYDALTGIVSYNINPASIRETHPHDPGDRLTRDGANLAAVIKRLADQDARPLERIQEYLRRIIPDIERVEHQALGPQETLVFRQRIQRQKDPWRFWAASMSDGTLRSLGVLAALFQWGMRQTEPSPLVAIEEPEATVHPGAAATIAEALLEASNFEQVMMTTHSPDLLDHKALAQAAIYAVDKIGGETTIAPVSDASRSAIQDGLYTPGELLREGQLQPAKNKILNGNIRHRDLFQEFR